MCQVSFCSPTLWPSLLATGSTKFHTTTKYLLVFDWSFEGYHPIAQIKATQTEEGIWQWPLPKCPIPHECSGSLKPWLQQSQFTNLLLSVTLLKSTWGLYLPTKFARWTFFPNLKKFRFKVKEEWEVAACVYYVETGHTNTQCYAEFNYYSF